MIFIFLRFHPEWVRLGLTSDRFGREGQKAAARPDGKDLVGPFTSTAAINLVQMFLDHLKRGHPQEQIEPQDQDKEVVDLGNQRYEKVRQQIRWNDHVEHRENRDEFD